MSVNYFDVPAVSNSLLKRVGFFYQEKNLDRFSEQEVKESEAMFIGSQVHLAVETKGNSIADLKVLDDSCFKEKDEADRNIFSPNLIKVVKSDTPYETYLDLYNDRDVKLVKGDDFDKSEKAKQRILDKIELLQTKAASYFTSRLGLQDTDIVLNDIDYISNPESVKETIISCYNAVMQSPDYNDLVEYDLFERYDHYHEFAYYSELDGIPTKALIDELIVLHDRKLIKLIDLKTYGGNTSLEKNMFKYDYCHQLSWYRHWIKEWAIKNGYGNYEIEVSVVSVSTSSYKVEVMYIDPTALDTAEVGGYFKPSIYTLYDEYDQFNPYLTQADVEWLRHVNIWKSDRTRFKRLGWREHFEIGKQIFDELWATT